MIARVWRGRVPAGKADGYGEYLAHSELGVPAYQAVPGNGGALLFRRNEEHVAEFLLISFWESTDAIKQYTGPDIKRAQYFRYDLECLVDPEPTVSHYDVLASTEVGGMGDQGTG